MRKLDKCINCGELNQMAAFGLCFKCYRRETRMKQNPVNRHPHPALVKEQKKLLRGYHHITTGMVEVGVSPDHVKQVMSVIAPYLTSIRDHLLPGESVNSEQKKK